MVLKVLQKFPPTLGIGPWMVAEVWNEFFLPVFLCQRSREIWCEIFRVLRFPGFGCPLDGGNRALGF